MLEFRFGVFKALAYTASELANKRPESDLSMDRLTASAILEFGDDLRQAYDASIEWVEKHRGAVQPNPEGGCGRSGMHKS